MALVVQSLSHVQLFETSWTAAGQASLSFTISWSLLKLMSIELVMPSNHLSPLSAPSPPALNLAQYQGLFQWVGSLHQVAKVVALVIKNPPSMWEMFRDLASVLGLGRYPGGGDGTPLQYSCLEIPRTESLAGYSPCGQKSWTGLSVWAHELPELLQTQLRL